MKSAQHIFGALMLFVGLTLSAQESNQLLSRDFWSNNPSLADVKASVAAGNDPSEPNGSNFDPVVLAITNDAPVEIVDYLFEQEGNSVNKLTHDGRTYIFWAVLLLPATILQSLTVVILIRWFLLSLTMLLLRL